MPDNPKVPSFEEFVRSKGYEIPQPEAVPSFEEFVQSKGFEIPTPTPKEEEPKLGPVKVKGTPGQGLADVTTSILGGIQKDVGQKLYDITGQKAKKELAADLVSGKQQLIGDFDAEHNRLQSQLSQLENEHKDLVREYNQVSRPDPSLAMGFNAKLMGQDIQSNLDAWKNKPQWDDYQKKRADLMDQMNRMSILKSNTQGDPVTNPYPINPAVPAMRGPKKTPQEAVKSIIQEAQTPDIYSELINKGTDHLVESAKNMESREGFLYGLGKTAGFAGPIIAATAASLLGAPEVGAAIGAATTAAFGASGSGQMMQAYEEYQKAKGKPADPEEREVWGVMGGLATTLPMMMGAKMLPEGFVTSTLAKSMMQGAMGPAERKVVAEFISKNPSLAKRLLSDTFDAGVSGAGQMTSMTASLIAVENAFKEAGDKTGILDAAKEVVKAGAMGGMTFAFLGPLKTAATSLNQTRARERAGSVTLGVDKNTNQVVELLGKDKDGMWEAYTNEPKRVTLRPDEVESYINVPLDVFNQIQKEIPKNRELALESETNFYKKRVDDNIDQIMPTITREDGTILKAQKKEDGSPVLIVNGDPSVDNLVRVTDGMGNQEMISPTKLDLTKAEMKPAEQFAEELRRQQYERIGYEQTIKGVEKGIIELPTPEELTPPSGEVAWKGPDGVTRKVKAEKNNPDTGEVLIKGEENGQPFSEWVSPKELLSHDQALAEQKAREDAIKQAEVAQKEAEKNGIEVVTPITKDAQKPAQTWTIGKKMFSVEQQEDGSRFIPFKEGQDDTKTIKGEVDLNAYNVIPVHATVPIPDAPEFAKVKEKNILTGVKIVRKQAAPDIPINENLTEPTIDNLPTNVPNVGEVTATNEPVPVVNVTKNPTNDINPVQDVASQGSQDNLAGQPGTPDVGGGSQPVDLTNQPQLDEVQKVQTQAGETGQVTPETTAPPVAVEPAAPVVSTPSGTNMAQDVAVTPERVQEINSKISEHQATIKDLIASGVSKDSKSIKVIEGRIKKLADELTVAQNATTEPLPVEQTGTDTGASAPGVSPKPVKIPAGQVEFRGQQYWVDGKKVSVINPDGTRRVIQNQQSVEANMARKLHAKTVGEKVSEKTPVSKSESQAKPDSVPMKSVTKPTESAPKSGEKSQKSQVNTGNYLTQITPHLNKVSPFETITATQLAERVSDPAAKKELEKMGDAVKFAGKPTSVDVIEGTKTTPVKRQPVFAGKAVGKDVAFKTSSDPKQVVADLEKNVKNGYEVVLTSKPEDFPEYIQKLPRFKESMNDIDAITDHESESVFITPRGIRSPENARLTWIHEQGIHAGVRKLAGKDWKAVVRNVVYSVPLSELKRVVPEFYFEGKDLNNLTEREELELGNEYLAYLGEELVTDADLTPHSEDISIDDLIEKAYGRVHSTKGDHERIIRGSIQSTYRGDILHNSSERSQPRTPEVHRGKQGSDQSNRVRKVSPEAAEYAVKRFNEDIEGFTITPNGEIATGGYGVSIFKGGERKYPNGFTQDDINAYYNEFYDAIEQPGMFIGGYIDGAGVPTLDVSHVEPDFYTAIQKGIDHQQDGIWDMTRNVEIATNQGFTAEQIAELEKRKRLAAGESPDQALLRTSRLTIEEQNPEIAKNLEVKDGMVSLYHFSSQELSVADPKKFGTATHRKTSREEQSDLYMAPQVFFYVHESDSEGLGAFKHKATVRTDEVYDLVADKDGFYDEAKRRFQEARPNWGWNGNSAAAWMMKVASEKGYKVGLVQWGGRMDRATNRRVTTYRAQSAVEIPLKLMAAGQTVDVNFKVTPTEQQLQDNLTPGTNLPTTVPTWKDAPADRWLNAESVVSLENMRKVPLSYTKNADEIAKYDIMAGYHPPKNVENADEVYKIFVDRVKKNLLWLYDQSAPYKHRSKLWYMGAHAVAKANAIQHGLTIEQASAIMAVLSPQMDWYQNVHHGEAVMQTLANMQHAIFDKEMVKRYLKIADQAKDTAKKPNNHADSVRKAKADMGIAEGKMLKDLPEDLQAAFIRMYDEVHTDRTYQVISPEGDFMHVSTTDSGKISTAAWGSYGEINKAVSIFHNGSAENISAKLGDAWKVRNFYNNIVNPLDTRGNVTIDTHAVAAGLLKPLGGSSKEVAQNLGSGKAAKGISKSAITGLGGTYPAFTEAYREAAKEVGLLPSQLQSVVWETVRGLFVKKTPQVKKDINAIWRKFDGTNQESIQNEIITYTKGIKPPTWHRSDSGKIKEVGGTRDKGKLFAGDVLSGRGARPTATGVRNTTASGTTTDTAGRLVAEPDVNFKVNSPEFKRWFGDSVVTKDGKPGGEPMVVYHGTPERSKINVFNGSDSFDSGGAIGWFAEDRSLSNVYKGDSGKTYKVYLSIKNPFVLNVDADDTLTRQEFEQEIGFKLDRSSLYDPESRPVWLYLRRGSTSFQDQIAKKGYDGIKIKEAGIQAWGVIQSPSQIKSATGNNGQYSPENPDINYKIGDLSAISRFKTDLEQNAKLVGKSPTVKKKKIQEFRTLWKQVFEAEISEKDATKIINRTLGEKVFAGKVLQKKSAVPEHRWDTFEESVLAYGSESAARQAVEEAAQEALSTTIDGGSRLYGAGHIPAKRTVLKGFRESGYVDFVGTQIESPQDVADLWSIHRSPYIEKSHAIFTKDGVIVGSSAITMNQPDSSFVHPAETIVYLAKAFGADSFYLLHNHPSGNHKISQADKTVSINRALETRALMPNLKFEGHVVIDHNKFSYITTKDITRIPDDWKQNTNMTLNYLSDAFLGVEEFEYKNAVPKLFTERESLFSDPNKDTQERMFEIGKAILNSGGYPGVVVYLTPQMAITAWDVIPANLKESGVEQYVRNGMSHLLGARYIVVHNGSFDFAGRPMPFGGLDVINVRDRVSEVPRFESRDLYKKNVNILWEKESKYAGSVIPQTETPAFKKWFGDSKVVNPDGSPMVVYHGQSATWHTDPVTGKQTVTEPNEIKEFNNNSPKFLEKGNKGFYFTPSEKVARNYAEDAHGRVYPVYLNVKNPYFFDYYDKDKLINSANFINQKDVDKLKSMGYDGVWSYSYSPNTGEIVVFDSNQIKSATGNSGAFNPENPDINLKVTPPAVVEAFRSTMIPYDVGEGGKIASQIMSANLGDQAHRMDKASETLKAIKKQFDKMSKEESLDFIDNIENGLPQKNPELQGYADAIRDLLDSTRERVRALGTGKLENYIENYFPHAWEDPKKAAQILFSKRPLEGSKSFLKKRTIVTTKQGVDLGLIPVTWNPVEASLLKVRDMERYIMAHKTINELRDAGYVTFVRIGKERPEGYVILDDKVSTVQRKTDDGLQIVGHLYADKNVARIINNFLSKGLRGNILFDAYRGLGNTLTQFQLGLSLFHVGFTSMDATISKFALGLEYAYQGELGRTLKHFALTPLAPITNILQGDKLMKAWYGKPATPEMAMIAEYMAMAGGRARMDEFYANKFSDKIREHLKNHRYLRAGLEFPLKVVELAAVPVMEWIVPRQKLGVFMDMALYEMKVHPNATYEERRAALQRAWASVDNRMGQLVYDNLFWNKVTKDIAMASVRSVGWNLGTFREVGGAPVEIFKLLKQGAKGKRSEETHKIAYLIALLGITMLYSAIYQYLRTGKKPDELKDYFFPKTGSKDKNGDPIRSSLPTYTKDLYHYKTAPLKTIKNKLSPVNSIVAQMVTNKDFYGVKLRNEDDPIYKQGLDVLKYLGEQLIPFGIRNAQKTTWKNPEDKILPFIGIVPAPYDLNMTKAQEEAYRIQAQKLPVGGRTTEQQKKSDEKKALLEGLRESGGNTTPLQEKLRAGLISKDDYVSMVKTYRMTGIERSVTRFGYDEALHIYKVANAEEKRLLYPIVLEKLVNKLKDKGVSRAEHDQVKILYENFKKEKPTGIK